MTDSDREKRIEAAAKAIYEEPDQFGRGLPVEVTWEYMLTYGGEFPDNTEHPLADEYRRIARAALDAADHGCPVVPLERAQELRRERDEAVAAARDFAEALIALGAACRRFDGISNTLSARHPSFLPPDREE